MVECGWSTSPPAWASEKALSFTASEIVAANRGTVVVVVGTVVVVEAVVFEGAAVEGAAVDVTEGAVDEVVVVVDVVHPVSTTMPAKQPQSFCIR